MKSMKNLAKLAAALVVAGCASGVSAQTITFGTPTPASTVAGTAANGVSVVVTYTAPAMNPPAAIALDVTIPPQFTNVASGGDADCIVGQPEAGRIRISQIDLAGVPPAVPSGTVCTLTFDVGAAVPVGTYNFTTCGTGTGACVDGNVTPAFGPGFQVTAAPVVTGPTIVAGSPAFSSNTNVAGGTLGGPTVNQNISFGASTGGVLGGTTNLVCTDDDANTTLSAAATQNGITNGQTPTTIVASFTPGAARTVNVNCTATRQGTTDQTFSYTFNVAAGSVASGPVLTPPGATTLTVGGNAVGQQGTGSIVFTAAGGDAGQSTPLNCSVTSGTVVIVSGGTQNVNTGSQPAPVVVGVTLTNAAQANVGVVTCNGTAFTISAPAGSTFVPPEVIPASSLWSQLSLIALFAALGGLVLVLRRNG
jgi:hypothetical protein